MPTLSTADHSTSPPQVSFPPGYNAAHDLLFRNLQAGRSEKLAYIDDETSVTYGELERRTGATAHALQSLGVQREQRVMLCLQDTVEFPIAFLGAIRAGMVPVAVNTLLTQKDYLYLVNDCRASVAIVSAALLPLFETVRDRMPLLKHLIVAGTRHHPHSFGALIAMHDQAFESVDTHADEPCFWLYSSGSTGSPKGTIHAHASLMQTAELFGRGVAGYRETDVCFSAAKLFFAYGLGNALTFPLSVGATTILMAERATPAAVYQRFRKYRPTVFGGVPTLYASMLASAELHASGHEHLRLCLSAGEPLPAPIGQRWRSHFGVDILDGIGSTEMLHIFISNRPGAVEYGTTGKPVPGYEVKLLDERGLPVPPGEQGELHINGPSGAIQYWNNRERSRSTFLGPWTRSGDKFVAREDGTYIYAGRSDDMLKVSGIYVSPAEIEATLITHPAVLEAAVVGREDADGLTKPMAFIVLKDGSQTCEDLANELKVHVKSLLAPYKYPRWFEFRRELPKTATGKIQRFRLRAELKDPT